MNLKTLYGGILLLSGMFVFPISGFSAAPEPQSESAKQVVSLVEKAAALIKTQGKKAFPEFRKKGSEWYKDGTYIFVNNMQGASVVNPPTPEIEGKNILDVKDANGKAFIQEMVAVLKTKKSGWTEYMWPKPGETNPSKKISYIKKVKLGNETLIVGAGIYSD